MMMMQNLRGELTDLKKLPNMNTFSLKNNQLIKAVFESLQVHD